MKPHVARFFTTIWLQWFSGFGEIHILADFFPADGFIQHFPITGKDRLSQLIIAETASRTRHCFLILAIAINNPLHPLSGNGVCIIPHLNKDKFAVTTICLVHIQDSMGSSARASKRIQNQCMLTSCHF